MAQLSKEWGEAVRQLLEKHNLSLREAEEKAHGVVTKSYLGEWVRGKVPQYTTAVMFLKHFPREEAVEVLAAAGYPPPADWGARSNNVIEVNGIQVHLRTTHNGHLTDEEIEDIKRSLDQVKEILEKQRSAE